MRYYIEPQLNDASIQLTAEHHRKRSQREAGCLKN